MQSRSFPSAVAASLALALTLGAGLSCKKKTGAPGATPSKSAPLAIETPKQATVVAEGAPIGATLVATLGAGSKLISPRGVAVDDAGNVYVADTGKHRIVKLDGTGKELLAFGQEGRESGQFEQPWVVSITPKGEVAVLDASSNYLQTFTGEGALVSRICGPGKPGFYAPRGMGVGPDGVFYVADTGNDRVVPVTAAGEVKNEDWRSLGATPIKQVSDVSVGKSGLIRVYQPGGPEGRGVLFEVTPQNELRGWWVLPPSAATADASKVAELSDGRLVLSDPQQQRLIVVSANRSSYAAVQAEGLKLLAPGAVAVSKDDHVFLVDSRAGVVHHLKLSGK